MTEADALIRVEVIYAHPEHVWRRPLELPRGATAEQALTASGVLQDFPELGKTPPLVGIYGRSCALQQVLRSGDRLEIYRQLVFDPMESRRRRVKHRQRKAKQAA